MSEIKEVAQAAYRVFPRMAAQLPLQRGPSDTTSTSLADLIQQAVAATPLAEPISIPGPSRPWNVDDLPALAGAKGHYELVRGALILVIHYAGCSDEQRR